MNTYIGIDLGTSGVKCILCTAEGNILEQVTRAYPVLRPHDGWSEQDPETWWQAVRAAIAELVKGGLKATVKGIAAGGQMHGLVALDSKGDVIRPCILWNDGRTESQTEYLNNTVGKEKLSALTGNIAFAGFTAPKLLWMRENEPENFGRISKILLPKDYINYRLMGRFTTDYSDASGTLLLDVKGKCWSREMCGICGIQPAQLPDLYESYEKIGTLTAAAAEDLNLEESVIVAAGAGDNAAAAIGTGTVKDGSCNISLGTSGTLFISSDSFVPGGGDALHSFCHANGRWHLLGCILSAASCRGWWTETVLKQPYDEDERQAECAVTHGLYFLPYLSGERSPHNDVNARGAFIGLSHTTTAGEMSRAVMEGVAFALKDCMRRAAAGGICPGHATLCGGGAMSKVWRQIVADVLDIPVKLVVTEQGPSLGAAILAMAACGEYPDISAASAAVVKYGETVYPGEKSAAYYSAKYEVFTKIYPALKGVFADMRNC